MGLIPFWRFPSDAGTASATSTAGAGFAASNVQKQTLQKKWKSADGFGATIIIDMGSSIDLNTVGIFGHDILETDTFSFSVSNDPTFVVKTPVPLTWHKNYFFETFDTGSYRYAAFSFVLGVSGNRSVGRLAVGTSLELEHGLKTPGDAFGPGRTTSTSQRTTGGQEYGNTGVSMDVMRGTIPGLLAGDVAEVLELQRTYQTVVPFVSVIRYGLPNQSAIYGTFDSMATPKYVNEDRQEIAWRMTEQK